MRHFFSYYFKKIKFSIASLFNQFLDFISIIAFVPIFVVFLNLNKANANVS
ncbi:hypothetical protein PMI10_02842 [Flavobacterium sp. CF136]|nr:hypothetical protein PMI10_02842 [Flavobacterium sp. CF136]